ncbi:MAG: hypothetical protein LBB16_01290 [Puniceicoccales bacterium]|nr:hypothetical protein [Puniceicoccales bacterium]
MFQLISHYPFGMLRASGDIMADKNPIQLSGGTKDYSPGNRVRRGIASKVTNSGCCRHHPCC